MKRIAIAVLTAVSFYQLTLGSSLVYAVTVPSYPNCISPQGNVKVSYSSGTHGIVGNTGEYRGSDAVYTLTNDTLAQCFCPDSGAGIQTNWWKIPNLTAEEIQVLKNQGWIYVPNGALWGLEGVPYLAKNSDYSCKGGVGGSQGGTSVVGSAGRANLAGTGGSAQIFALIVSGFLCLFTGFRLRRKSRRSKRLRLRLA